MRALSQECEGARRFRLGAIDVAVSSDLREVLDCFSSLYAQFRHEGPPSDRTVRMEVRKSSRWRRRYDIYGDGQTVRRNRRVKELLPFLEWAINARVIATRSDYLQLHAATLALDGQGVILTGSPGAGKSTLAAGLAARGWRYLCDEFALIDPLTLRAAPFPKALCIKAGSFDVVRSVNLKLAGDGYHVKGFKGPVGYVSAPGISNSKSVESVPVRTIVFLNYAGGVEPQAYSVPRYRAVLGLAGQTLNRNVFGVRTASILSQLVKGAACWGLDSGEIGATCRRVEALLR